MAGAPPSQSQVQNSWQVQHFRIAAGAALSQGQLHVSWQAQFFRKVRYRFRGRGGTFARYCTDFAAGTALSPASGTNFLAGAPPSQGQVQNRGRCSTFASAGAALSQGACGKRSTFARSGPDFVAGAELSQGQLQISQQAQHFRKIRSRFRGRRSSTFARSGLGFAAGAALSQGQVQTLWQAQYFRKVRYKFRGRRNTFTRCCTDFAPRNPPANFQNVYRDCRTLC